MDALFRRALSLSSAGGLAAPGRAAGNARRGRALSGQPESHRSAALSSPPAAAARRHLRPYAPHRHCRSRRGLRPAPGSLSWRLGVRDADPRARADGGARRGGRPLRRPGQPPRHSGDGVGRLRAGRGSCRCRALRPQLAAPAPGAPGAAAQVRGHALGARGVGKSVLAAAARHRRGPLQADRDLRRSADGALRSHRRPGRASRPLDADAETDRAARRRSADVPRPRRLSLECSALSPRVCCLCTHL